jgi:hypothetical protein
MTFEEFVVARGAALVRFARLLTGENHRAEDLAQDVLAKAYVNWRRVIRADNPDLYVRRMLINAHHSWWRRRSNREVSVAVLQDHRSNGDAATEVTEREAMWRLRADPCQNPFRLTSIPAGMAVRQCSISLTRQVPRPRLEQAGLWVGDDERYAWLSVIAVDTPPE